jgi:hypothetical protein
MITWPPEHAEMGKVEAALIRAAQVACDQARRHGVPIVIWKEGRVVHEPVGETAPAAERKTQDPVSGS